MAVVEFAPRVVAAGIEAGHIVAVAVVEQLHSLRDS